MVIVVNPVGQISTYEVTITVVTVRGSEVIPVGVTVGVAIPEVIVLVNVAFPLSGPVPADVAAWVDEEAVVLWEVCDWVRLD